MRHKRHRGGQPGNQNALKNGLYSSRLSADQVCEIVNILNAGGRNTELIALRLKLTSALKSAPDNRRVFMEASKILCKWYLSRYDFGEKYNPVFQAFVRGVLKTLRENQSVLTERIVSASTGMPLNLTERIDSKNPLFSVV